jgi:hypothetical protein
MARWQANDERTGRRWQGLLWPTAVVIFTLTVNGPTAASEPKQVETPSKLLLRLRSPGRVDTGVCALAQIADSENPTESSVN